VQRDAAASASAGESSSIPISAIAAIPRNIPAKQRRMPAIGGRGAARGIIINVAPLTTSTVYNYTLRA
jgi:hypothetical protein